MGKILLPVLIGIMLIAAQCGGPVGQPVSAESPGLRRLVDKEAGVVCWYMLNSSHISCLPIEDTKLADR